MSVKHYINEIGSVILVNTNIDLTSASSVQLKVKKPDGTTATWNGSTYAVGSNTYYIKYTIVSGDLEQPGVYHIQPYVVLSNWSGYGETSKVMVYDLFS